MARIVFDLDGTLIDSAPDLHALANRILDTWGIEPVTLTDARTFIGQGVDVFVQRLRASRGIPDALHGEIRDLFMTGYKDAVDLTMVFEGATEALVHLRADGHAIGVCTNKPFAPAHAVLAHLGLLPLIDVLIGGDSTPQRKPEPEPLLAAFAALGNGPRIYVGDSEIDAEAASRAGVPFVFFTEGYLNAGLSELPVAGEFSDFRGLPELIDQTLGIPA